eukprot:SAG22_NODE_21328_length_258_cov_0.641509_1_plen_37_part_10
MNVLTPRGALLPKLVPEKLRSASDFVRVDVFGVAVFV